MKVNALRLTIGSVIDFDLSDGPVQITPEFAEKLNYEAFITFKQGEETLVFSRISGANDLAEVLVSVINGAAPEGKTLSDIWGLWGVTQYDAPSGELEGVDGIAYVETDDGEFFLIRFAI